MAVDHREVALPHGELGAETSAAAAGTPLRRTGLWGDAFVRFTRNRAAVAASAIFGVIVLYCVMVPFVSPYDPNVVNFKDAYLPASLQHPFGTDKFGRDLFTRIAIGGRISIAIGFAGTIAILTVGVVYGSIAGFLGGTVDDVLMRLLDALYGLPYLPFAIITTQILSPSGEVTFWTMVAALDRELAHDRADRQGPGDDAQTERVRQRRPGRGRTLVPDPEPPPAAEYARRAHHRGLPRPSGRGARRGVPLIHRSRDQPADGLMGLDRPGRAGRLRPPSSGALHAEPCHRNARSMR